MAYTDNGTPDFYSPENNEPQPQPQETQLTKTPTASALPPETIERYHAITKNLDVTDLNSVGQYGSELSSIMDQNSEELLKAVRTDNGGEIAALTTELRSKLDMIDVAELSNETTWKSIMRKIPILKHMVPTINEIFHKYDTISETVGEITKKIESVAMVSKRDNAALDLIAQNDEIYIKQIRELIAAATLKLEEVMNQKYQMEENRDQYEEYEFSKISNFINALEKKISDMRQVEYVLKLNLHQISTTQQNNNLVATKADTFVTTVVPVWKTQLSLAVMLNNNKKNIQALKEADDTSNRLIEESAKMLHVSSLEIAKESERGIFDAASLKKSTDLMIKTINEVNEIHSKASEERRKIIKELADKEAEMQIAIAHATKAQKNYLDTVGGHTLKELAN